MQLSYSRSILIIVKSKEVVGDVRFSFRSALFDLVVQGTTLRKVPNYFRSVGPRYSDTRELKIAHPRALRISTGAEAPNDVINRHCSIKLQRALEISHTSDSTIKPRLDAWDGN